MSRNRIRPAAIALALGLAASHSPAPGLAGGGGFAIAEAVAGEAKIFHGVGVVTAVDPAGGVLTVDHGDIPGLMDAMEMAYKVQPAGLAAGLRKGDRIAFAVDGATLTIVEIRKIASE